MSSLPELTDSPAIDCGYPAYEGVLLAYLPPISEMMSEFVSGDTTLYALDGLAIDTNPAKKWWLTRNLARSLKLDYPEPVWQGPAADLSYRTVYHIMEQQNAMQVGKKLHMRAFSHGPWICLEGENGVDAVRLSVSEGLNKLEGTAEANGTVN